MQRRSFTSGLLSGVSLCSVGIAPAAHAASVLSDADASSGIRAALERGAEAAVSLLGKPDGFLGNPKVKIALPGFLKDGAKLLKATGQGKRVDELVTAMNRAAEAAVPEAKELLLGAVKSMSVEDGARILSGGDTSGIESLKWMDAASVAELLSGTHAEALRSLLIERGFVRPEDFQPCRLRWHRQ